MNIYNVPGTKVSTAEELFDLCHNSVSGNNNTHFTDAETKMISNLSEATQVIKRRAWICKVKNVEQVYGRGR